jgi:hypothetical protein
VVDRLTKWLIEDIGKIYAIVKLNCGYTAVVGNFKNSKLNG